MKNHKNHKTSNKIGKIGIIYQQIIFKYLFLIYYLEILQLQFIRKIKIIKL